MAQTLADRDAYIARLMEALRQIALLANHAPWVCEDIADTALADAGAGKERGDE